MAAREYTCAACGCVRVQQMGMGGRPRKRCEECAQRLYKAAADRKRWNSGDARSKRERRRRRLRRIRVFQYSVPLIAGKCQICGDPMMGTRSQMDGRRSCSMACEHNRTQRTICVCKHCGKNYTPKHNDRISCCSRECGFKYLGQIRAMRKPPKYSRVYFRECRACGRSFASRHKSISSCSDACRLEVGRRKSREYSKVRYVSRRQDALVECGQCGKSFSQTSGRTIYCSDACSRKALRGTHRKRARRAGVAYTSFKTVDVFERDAWTCMACGCDTPKALRGTYDDSAPELDHVIPISKGGPHIISNCQCLCRACNIMKGSMSMDQFVLWNTGQRTDSVRFSTQ